MNSQAPDEHNVRRRWRRTRIALPVLLPNVPDARDECVRRLEELLAQRTLVSHANLVDGPDADELCVHYDPERVSLETVTRIVRAAGAEVTKRYGHRVWPVRMVGAEDAGRKIEETLRGVEGVLSVAANLAGQVVRVEFERGRFDP